MSMNLSAKTRSGKSIELLQTNTDQTYWCMGYDGKGGFELGRELTWKEIRDRYITVVEERLNGYSGDTWLKNHMAKMRHYSCIEFTVT